MATAQRAWLLLAVATTTVACAQILGIQPWEPSDAGLGGGGAATSSTGTTTASSTDSTTSSTSSSTTTSSTTSTTSTTSSATTTTSSTSTGGPVCMTSMTSCFGCEKCANGDGGACEMAHDTCQNDTGGCAALENCVLGCSDPGCIQTTCAPEAGAAFTNWVKCYCHQCGSPSVCNAVFQVYCADAGP